jgi:hypothetical protein
VLTTPGNGQLKLADTPINISVSRPATILRELTLLKVSNGRRPLAFHRSSTPARGRHAFRKSEGFDEKEIPSQMPFTPPWRER